MAERSNVGNPSALGLFGFALTTFVLSSYNAGIFGARAGSTPVNAVVGAAVFYGGTAQFAAGMWEIAAGNAFGGTAFASYAAFWLSYAAILIPWFGVSDAYSADPDAGTKAVAIFLLAWTLFTATLLVASFRTSAALVALFSFLTLTFLLLTVAEYNGSVDVKRAAGFFGVFTAAIAWYNGLAALLASHPRPLFTLPVLHLHDT
jgi:succinate-acetate transporter protein